MALTLHLVLIIVSAILFIVAATIGSFPRANLAYWAMAFFVLSFAF